MSDSKIEVIMDSSGKYIADIFFKNKILTSEGQAFEDLFVKVMSLSNSNFKPIKAYGRLGDGKNDGYDKEEGVFYQVYGPEDLTKDETAKKAAKKLENDFKGLYELWNPHLQIKKYYFVINDKFKGVPLLIENKLLELRRNPLYTHLSIDIFNTADLQKVFMGLDDWQVYDVVGYIPGPDIPVLEITALTEAIEYLNRVPVNVGGEDTLTVPDFEQKMIFNDLGARTRNWLITGSYHESDLQQYFKENPGSREYIKEKFSTLYEESKEKYPETDESCGDKRFVYILNKARGNNVQSSVMNSIIVLMSYYFSTCDIFEDPNK